MQNIERGTHAQADWAKAMLTCRHSNVVACALQNWAGHRFQDGEFCVATTALPYRLEHRCDSSGIPNAHIDAGCICTAHPKKNAVQLKNISRTPEILILLPMKTSLKEALGGFTLTELLIVMAIMATLAAIALPTIETFIGNSRIRSTTSDLVTNIALARSEAIRRGVSITICPTSSACDGTEVPSCSGTADWNANRLIFVESGAGGATGVYEPALNPPDVLLRCERRLANTTVAISNGATSLTALPSGWLNSDGAFTVCSTGLTQRNVTFRRTGRSQAELAAATCP